MSLQTGYYAVDTDEAELLSWAEELGMRALPYRAPTDAVDDGLVEAVLPTHLAATSHGHTFYLLPAGLAPVEAVLPPVPGRENVSCLDDVNSPVIEFRPSQRSGSDISAGRVYLGQNSADTLHPVVRKAYDALTRRLRKWPTVGRYRVGPKTLAEARTGAVRLMLAPGRARTAEELAAVADAHAA
jgi:hypothetical protein